MALAPQVTRAYNLARTSIKGRLDGHYQHEGVMWMLGRELSPSPPGTPPGGILADDMGLGKTMQAIATMVGNPQQTLIITIVSTLAQWQEALVTFGGLCPLIINCSFKGIIPQTATTVLTTYSVFQKRTKALQALLDTQWGRVILDEGHQIRTPTNQTSKEIAKLTSTHRWILSGTPVQNSDRDLIALARWLGYPGLGPGDPDPARGAERGLRPDPEPQDICEAIVLRRTQEEQAEANPRLALPPLDTQQINLDLSPAERDFYDEVAEYFMADNLDGLPAMEGIMRCRQAATHPLLYKEGIGRKRKAHVAASAPPQPSPALCEGRSTKLDFLVTDIQDLPAPNNKCLVFCNWTTEMKLISDALTEAGIACQVYDGSLSRTNKEATLHNFKNTPIQVLIIQINCGAEGLNLQCASYVYITSPNWNPCVELQAIGRAYRKGQQNRVTCKRLIMSGTIEEECGEVQHDKVQTIIDVMGDESFGQRLGDGP